MRLCNRMQPFVGCVFIFYVSAVTSSVPKTWKKPKEDAVVEQTQCPDREVSLGHIVGPALFLLGKFIYNFTN